jgi:FHS family glucose/mannose:H+ symporter-like MFS transporter
LKQAPPLASVPPHSSTQSQERRLTWLAYACIFVEGINAGWIGPFLPEISHLVHVSIDHAGLIVSATAAGYFAALLAAGETSHRWSAQSTLAASMLLVSGGLFGLSFAPILIGMLCAAFVAGLGYGAIDVASNAMVVDLNRDRLAAALNYLHVMFGVGALLGPIIAGFALSHHLRYSIMFAAGAAFSALIAVLLFTTPTIETSVIPTRGDGFIPMLTRPLIWVVGAVLFLYVGAETGIGAWLFLYLRTNGALSESLASWGVSLYWAGLILGRLIGGRLAHYIAAREFTMLAAAVSALALIVLIAAPTMRGLAAPMIVLIGFGYGPIFPNMIAVGAARFPSEVGRMTSIVVAGGALGGIFVPWIMGHAIVVASPRAAMEFALGITALMALISVAGLRTRRILTTPGAAPT